MKKSLFAIAALALLIASTTPAHAYRGWGGGADCCQGGNGGSGYSQQQLTAEQQATFSEIQQKYEAKAEPVRESLIAKRMELDAIKDNPNTTRADIQELTSEITDLRGQMRDIREAYIAEVEEKVGPEALRGYGRGYGRSGRGADCYGGDCPGYGRGYGDGPRNNRGGRGW